MPYDPDQLLHDFDSNHGAVLDSSEPGFTINSDGSFTISQLVNTVGPIGGYGSFQDNNNGPFGTPSEQDLVAFRVTSDTVDSSFYTYPFQYYFDRENATLDGVNTSPPQGAILVGYAQVGSTQAFLLEQLASYVAGSVPVPGVGNYPGTTYFLLTNDDSQTSLDNIDPKGNAKITPSFFANGPVTFEPPSFTFECFTSGTHIATPAGQRLVQDLKPGDLVLTARGEATAIAWAGKRTLDCSRHPNPAAVSPVLIEPGAFADAVPSRPLRLSPDHAVLIEDVLIPIKHLINGTTIRQVPADVVTYHHIELERHDVLLAEGLAAESYLDVGQRAVFSGGATVVAYPDFGAQRWEAEGCAPLMVAGAAVDRARAHLNTRAAAAAAATQQHVQRTA